MNNEYEFFSAPHFHDRYETYHQEVAECVVVEYVGVVKPVCDKEHAVTLYTKSEKRIRILNRILKKIERMMNYDL